MQTSAFKELKNRDPSSMHGKQSITNTEKEDKPEANLKKKDSREIFKEMSKAELEILSIKNKDKKGI